ncbi:MAG: hypothetical protein KKI14_01335, partial [Nanoarchaeota archaeon]|nr:hypothetical protein [Nanoarchaeota archaeon]
MVKKIKKMEYEHHPTNLLSKYVGEIDTCIFHERDIDYKERKVLVVQAEIPPMNKASSYLIVPGYIQSQKI